MKWPAALLSIASLLLVAGAADAGAAVTVRGSVEQVHVTGAGARTRVTLIDRRGEVVAARRAGRLGGVVFRGVDAGRGYRVRGARRKLSRRVTVLPERAAPPSRSIYDQLLRAPGYGYLTTRDGTKLAVNVQLPPGEGPFPTLVEYGGYGYADPAGGQSSIARIGTLLGYAVVDVNMRGTGCSGGAFDYFEPLQALDGYDVIETVARQPWVRGDRVGMMGISYGGISQLFVAARRPPSLAAIAPLSVIDDSLSTAYPGGVLNTGFTLRWVRDRMNDARHASASGGQEWAFERIEAGDRTCRANQALHTEAVDLLAKTRRNRYYDPAIADPLSPVRFVHRIDVPVFLACQFNDEQTGGHCPALADRFTGTRRKWFTFTNGTHIDSLAPETFLRWFDFVELYVARRAPRLTPAVAATAPAIYEVGFGIPGITLPADPIQSHATYRDARAAFERLPSVRILFENGTGSATPRSPRAGFERSFPSLPVPGTRGRSWFFGAGGALTDARPTGAAADTFTWDRRARPAATFTGDEGAGGLWGLTPQYRWDQHPPGTALSYLTAPLAADTVVVGAGAVEAWIRSPARRVDLQVTVSEVRPDGMETFVQNGWLRTTARTLDRRRSTPLEPVPSFRRSDEAPLPRRGWAKITVPLYYQGHAYRTGSRIRVTLGAPGGDQPLWKFGAAAPNRRTAVSVARSRTRPSRVLLPVVDTVDVPTALPPCGTLRGQPCRPYVPLVNRPAG